MKPEKKEIIRGLVAAALLVFCVAGWIFTGMYLMDGSHFIGTPRLPVPPRATKARTYFSSIGLTRSVEFETDLSVEQLRQFYGTRMADAGWQLECTYTEEVQQGPGDCESGYQAGRELGLIFRKGSDPTKIHTVGVQVFSAGETEKRKVELHESMYELSPTVVVPESTRLVPPADYPAPETLLTAYP